jgi:hypothetical protein
LKDKKEYRGMCTAKKLVALTTKAMVRASAMVVFKERRERQRPMKGSSVVPKTS